MGRGGKRENAGRKAGAATVRSREIADNAVLSGLTPLEYLLSVLRDTEADARDRFEAAKHAAPYVHARISPIDAKGGQNGEEAPVPLAVRLKAYAREDAIQAGEVVELKPRAKT